MKFIVIFSMFIPSIMGIISRNRENPHLGIIGGTTLYPHSLPYMALLNIMDNTTNNTRICGGALISPNYILTAARCLINAKSVEVVLGVHSISATDENHVSLQSTNFTSHDDFNSTTFENDIALITLPSSAPINENIATWQIATQDNLDDIPEGTVVKTAGWGLEHSHYPDSYSDTLLALFLRVIPNYGSECGETFGDLIHDTNICCSDDNGWESPVNICEGDYGGPLVLDSMIIGVASFTHSNCDLGKPNVFTRITEYTSWLAENSDVPL